ncbi:MAG: hypothetical protein QM607_04350 [Microbacterium sp.]
MTAGISANGELLSSDCLMSSLRYQDTSTSESIVARVSRLNCTANDSASVGTLGAIVKPNCSSRVTRESVARYSFRPSVVMPDTNAIVFPANSGLSCLVWAIRSFVFVTSASASALLPSASPTIVA